MAHHTILTLPAYPRGFHLITEHIEHHLRTIHGHQGMPSHGVLHVFIQHSSASLTINENADPTVRQDLEAFVNQLVPEDTPYFIHTYEGSDDMPAHVKASIFGSSVQVPIIDGSLALGTWQGIYLGEHRNHGGKRKLVLTVMS